MLTIGKDLDIKPLPGTRPLGNALTVSGPYKVEKAPNAYSFERSNAIDINWERVLKATGFAVPESNSHVFKQYIAKAWGIADPSLPPAEAVINARIQDLSATWPAYVHDADTLTNAVQTNSDHITIFRDTLREHRKAPIATATRSIIKGCVIQVPTKSLDRWYQPIIFVETGEPEYPVLADFIGGKWADTWKQVTGLVQVYFPGAFTGDPANDGPSKKAAICDAMNCFPAAELIRADAATIDRQYRMLLNDGRLEVAFDTRATSIATQIETAPPAAIPTLTAQFRELKNFAVDRAGKKRQLADAASDLNYDLFTSDTQVTFYEDRTGVPKTETLKEGELYVKSQRTASWVTYHTATSSSSGFFGIGASSSSWQVPTFHSKNYTYYEKAIIDADPWVEILDFLRNENYETYLFRMTDQGLRSADGSSPASIINRCHENEEFRRRCVIALPQKELTLIGQTFVVGYNILIRPVPEIGVARPPEIAIRERLSYRFTWTGVALGDLAATIPLSPGEQREVTLTTSQRYESSRSETATSLVDITRIDRADFETVFEKEVRKENESETTVGAEVGGSIGVVQGSANFSKKDTTKEIARTLNRSVQRASQEVNRRSKDETTITVSEKVETSQTSTTTYRVKNINDGSTLNIAFYRLYNAYQSLLKLDDFKFLVRAGRSPFVGLDLLNEISFEREEKEELIEYIRSPEAFPFDLSGMSDDQKVLFETALFAEIARAYEEYPIDEKDPDESEGSKSTSEATAAFNPLSNLLSIDVQELDLEARAERLDTIKRAFSDIEDKIVGLPFWLEKTNFAYDSGGLYADVYVGIRPATEPYAENMRRLEEQKVAAEVSVTQARSRYLNARAAKHQLGFSGVLEADKIFISDRDVLYLEDDHAEVKVRLIPGMVWNEGWSLILKTADQVEGGSFLQDRSPSFGVLSFKLPRRFVTSDLASKGHEWFKDNVTAENRDLSIKIKYKVPT